MFGEIEILKIVTNRLEENNIQYMITGSIAMTYYAMPRMTRDLDIIVELETKDAERFYNLFKDDFYISPNLVREEIENRGMFNIIHLRELSKVDFILRKNSEYRKIEFNRRKKVKIDDVEVWIVSIEDLVLSKLFWAKESHSEMQLADVKNLLKAETEMDYIERWSKKLGIFELLQETLN